MDTLLRNIFIFICNVTFIRQVLEPGAILKIYASSKLQAPFQTWFYMSVRLISKELEDTER